MYSEFGILNIFLHTFMHRFKEFKTPNDLYSCPIQWFEFPVISFIYLLFTFSLQDFNFFKKNYVFIIMEIPTDFKSIKTAPWSMQCKINTI